MNESFSFFTVIKMFVNVDMTKPCLYVTLFQEP